MPDQQSIGSFDLDLAVRACSAGCRMPARWTHYDGSFVADTLLPAG